MARPVVGASTEELYRRLGVLTSGDEEIDWHLLKFLDALCSVMLEDVWTLVTDDPDSDRPGWGIMLDADEAPSYVLDYLAQFPGVRLEPGLSDDSKRAAIKAREGWDRGKPAAIVAGVQRYLTGGKHVRLIERTAYGTDGAWRLFIRTYDLETPDEQLVRTYLLTRQKPGGIILDYESIPGEIYNDWEAGPGSGTYNEVEPDFGTYDEAETYIIP